MSNTVVGKLTNGGGSSGKAVWLQNLVGGKRGGRRDESGSGRRFVRGDRKAPWVLVDGAGSKREGRETFELETKRDNEKSE